MRKPTIKKGDKFNKLTAIEFRYKDKKSYQYWLFRCDCGNEKLIRVSNIKSGHIKSCGCSRIGMKNGIKHGMINTGTYRSWCAMKTRCLNKNDEHYEGYGKRGITVCQEWMKFEKFYLDMGERPQGKSIDRMDNNKGYYKKNCRWSFHKQQCNNRRDNRILTHNGKIQTIAEWARELGIKYHTLYCRLKKGWSIEKSLSVKKRVWKRH